MFSPSFLTAPPTLLMFASIITCALVLGLTPPSSFIRPAALPLMVSYAYFGIVTSSADAFSHPLFANLVGGSLANMVLRYIDLVLLSAWSAKARGPTSKNGSLEPTTQKDTKVGRGGSFAWVGEVWWALTLIFNNRLVDTAWEVKHVPRFSKDRSGWVPSRMRYVWSRGATAVVCFILLDATRLLGAPPEQNAVLFAPEKVAFFSRLGDVSMEEVAMRYVSAIMFGVVTFLLFEGVHCGVGAIWVGLGLSHVKTWRPCFGTIFESWSLRRFWGMYWHQGLRQTLHSLAAFVTHRLFGLKHGGLLGRYLKIALVFYLSGAMHIFGDIAAGLDWYGSGVIRYFGTQVLGLMIEDCVQAAYHLAVKSDKRAVNYGLWQHVLGFVWVLSFMAWSVPVYTYPTSRRDRGQGVLPVKVLDRAIWWHAEA